MEMALIAALFLVLVVIVLFWSATLYKGFRILNVKSGMREKEVKCREQQRKYKEERLLSVLRLDNSGFPIDKVVEIVKNYRRM